MTLESLSADNGVFKESRKLCLKWRRKVIASFLRFWWANGMWDGEQLSLVAKPCHLF